MFQTAFLGAYNRIFTSFFRYLHELHGSKYKSMMLLLSLFFVSRRKCCRPVLRSLRVRMSPEDGAGFLFVRGATVRGWRIFLWLFRRGKIFDSGEGYVVVMSSFPRNDSGRRGFHVCGQSKISVQGSFIRLVPIVSEPLHSGRN